MASAAEQLARNLQWSSFAKAKDLQARIWYTLAILVAYRLGTYIPIPGINIAAFAQVFQNAQGGILGMFNMFSGGAIQRLALFALNVMPYISASIIIQILASFPGKLEQMKKDGESGRAQMNQYTRYLTVVLALAQSYAIAANLQSAQGVVDHPGILFIASTMITLTGGTLLLMWMGEQITNRGIGNGVSLIIFAGIVAQIPTSLIRAAALAEQGSVSTIAFLALMAVLAIAVITIVFVERSQRRVLVQYPKRQHGGRMSQAETSFLPLKINVSGVIPPIFASSLLLLPATILGFFANKATNPDDPIWVQKGMGILQALAGSLSHGHPLFIILYGLLIVFFCFFYTSIVFNTEETADNLRKNGGFLPGIRPGANTAVFLDKVMTRLTVIGAVYIAAVCLIPETIIPALGLNNFFLGGTSLLIVVSVTIDTVGQIQSHMLAQQYEGLLKKSRLKGRQK